MGTPYYHIYRIWREPEHRLIAEGDFAKCRGQMSVGEGVLKYLLKRIRDRTETSFSVEIRKSTDLGLNKRKHPGLAGGADRDLPTPPNRIELLCGECEYFHPGERRNGIRVGQCSKGGILTERCSFSRLEGEERERHHQRHRPDP